MGQRQGHRPDHLLVGVLPAGRSGDDAVLPLTAVLVARPVDRRDHLLGDFGAFLQNLAHQIRGHILEAGLVFVAVDLQHLVEDELEIADRRLVGHGVRLSL